MANIQKKRKRGRPRKRRDFVEPWQFFRAGMVIAAYDQARRKGEKHSVGVREAVQSVKQQATGSPISDTEVRRVLRKYRGRGIKAVLLFEKGTTSKQKLRRRRLMREQIPPEYRADTEPSPSASRTGGKKRTTFKIRLAERPEYPRHNRKPPE